MYIVTNHSTTRKGIPCVGIVEPNGGTGQLSDDEYANISAQPTIAAWVSGGAISFTQSVEDSALQPPDTSGPSRYMTQEEIDDPDIDTTDDPNRPSKLALLEQLAAYGIIESTKSSEEKLTAMLVAAEAEE